MYKNNFKDKKYRISTFEEFVSEGASDTSFDVFSKNRADGDGRETNDRFDDINIEVVNTVKEKIESCVETLESVYEKLKETNITTKPIESSLADLKTYLSSLEKTQKTLTTTNTLNL